MAIVGAEQNAERRNYYQFLWETGAAQTDAANMTAENVDWKNCQIIYRRANSFSWLLLAFGDDNSQAMSSAVQELQKR